MPRFTTELEDDRGEFEVEVDASLEFPSDTDRQIDVYFHSVEILESGEQLAPPLFEANEDFLVDKTIQTVLKNESR